jgi:hypothetical protein
MTYKLIVKSRGIKMDSATIIANRRQPHSFRNGVLVIQSSNTVGSYILPYERSRPVSQAWHLSWSETLLIFFCNGRRSSKTLIFVTMGAGVFCVCWFVLLYSSPQTKQRRLSSCLLSLPSYTLTSSVHPTTRDTASSGSPR